MLFSQIIPPSPSPTESNSLFFTSFCTTITELIVLEINDLLRSLSSLIIL